MPGICQAQSSAVELQQISVVIMGWTRRTERGITILSSLTTQHPTMPLPQCTM